jgi:hypothetical protein
MSPLEAFPGYRAVLVLDMPKPDDKFIIYAGGIHDTMSANSRYSTFSTDLTSLGTDITDLTKAQTGFRSKPPTKSKAERNTISKKSRTCVRVIAGKVQKMADEDSPNAEAIITEAGFKVKRIPIRQKQKSCVTDGPESGAVYVFGEGQGAHNVRISTDGDVWDLLPASKGNRILVKGLTVGKTYYFQTSPVQTDGVLGIWSQTMEIVVR